MVNRTTPGGEYPARCFLFISGHFRMWGAGRLWRPFSTVLGSRLGRSWTSATGRHDPSRQARPACGRNPIWYLLFICGHFVMWVSVWVKAKFQPKQQNAKIAPDRSLERFLWSCYPDSNWRPHPYQVIKNRFLAYLLAFPALSAQNQLVYNRLVSIDSV